MNFLCLIEYFFLTQKFLKLKNEGLQNHLATPSKYNHDYSKGTIIFTFKRGTNGFIKHVLNLFKKKKYFSVIKFLKIILILLTQIK